jgi:head-tail adaptor
MTARSQRISIYRRNDPGQNSFGEDVPSTPTTVASSISADVRCLAGRELERVSQRWAEARYKIRIGWQPSEIKREDYISWNGQTLDILDVQGSALRTLEWTIIAKDHVE